MNASEFEQRLKNSTDIPDGLLFYRSDNPAEQRVEWQSFVAHRYAERAAEIVGAETPTPQSLVVSVSAPSPSPSPVADDSRYWSIERAAQECDVCVRTVAQWLADGKIRYYKPSGRVLIDPVELKEDLTKFRRQKKPKRRKQRVKPQPSKGLHLADDSDPGPMQL